MKSILLILITLFSLHLKAQELKIEPVYGIESTRREFPEPANQITKTYLGLSLVYGIPLISAELEVAQSIFHDSYPSTDTKVKSTTNRAMLGIRSYPLTSKYFGWYFRAGMRAKQETLEITEAGATRTEKKPMYLDPYGGSGLTIAFANNFSLNAGVTLVYNRSADVPENEKYDTQYTLSATIKMGNH